VIFCSYDCFANYSCIHLGHPCDVYMSTQPSPSQWSPLLLWPIHPSSLPTLSPANGTVHGPSFTCRQCGPTTSPPPPLFPLNHQSHARGVVPRHEYLISCTNFLRQSPWFPPLFVSHAKETRAYWSTSHCHTSTSPGSGLNKLSY
jgi:hypothetical protein